MNAVWYVVVIVAVLGGAAVAAYTVVERLRKKPAQAPMKYPTKPEPKADKGPDLPENRT